MKSTSTGSFPKSCSYTQPRAAIRSVVQCVFSRRRILSKTAVTVTPMKTGHMFPKQKMANPDEPWRDVTTPDDSLPSPRQPHPGPHATFAPMHIADISSQGRKTVSHRPWLQNDISKSGSRPYRRARRTRCQKVPKSAKKCQFVPRARSFCSFFNGPYRFHTGFGSQIHFRSL